MQPQKMEARGRVIASVGGDHGGPFLLSVLVEMYLYNFERSRRAASLAIKLYLQDRALEGHLRCCYAPRDVMRPKSSVLCEVCMPRLGRMRPRGGFPREALCAVDARERE